MKRPPGRLGRTTAVTLVLMLGMALSGAHGGIAYPLDGYERTGIRRLEAYRLAHDGVMTGPAQVPGALLSSDQIRLRLLEAGASLDVDAATPKDPDLQAGLEAIFAPRAPSYAVAVLDITDPHAPRYAALRDTETYLPGSVGKILVMTGLFAALADLHPDPVERLRLLRETVITADRFAMPNSHSVPVVDLEARTLLHRSIRPGDRFNLFEWVDHAVSPSSNAAGSMTWREVMLLRRFGAGYPPSDEERERFFRETPRGELQRLALESLEEPLRRTGLDVDELRIGTMFTRGAEAAVPGVRSLASPRELLRWLVRLEQGRLVDRWSSLEMKRLLYMTRRRYRYAVSPALDRAAVYFKSGSFYQCVPEPGFECAQYRGNRTNLMNSVAIVENPARPAPEESRRVYLVTLMSNVLRKNSAEDHRDIGTEIDRLIATLHR